MCDPKTWEMIKAEYIAGGMSYAALAKKYGTSKAAICRRATAEGWKQLMERVRNETETRVQEDIVPAIVEQRVDRFRTMYALADTFQNRLVELLDLPMKNGRQAHDMADALNGTMQLIRDLYGLPGEQQMQGRQRLDLMRRDMDLKEKAEAREQAQEETIERWVIETEAEDGS